MHGLSLVAASGDTLRCGGRLLVAVAVAPLVAEHGF